MPRKGLSLRDVMRYKIRAYTSRTVGESGRTAPLDTFQTGDSVTARYIARGAADDYGAAVLENTDTGERTWFEKGK